MFDQLREAMRGLSDRHAPEERRRVAATMKEAFVHAKLAMQDLRAAIATTEQRLVVERRELETVQRRLGLAAQIGDHETVTIAERFAAQHTERVAVLESKLLVQQQELTLNERELDDMSQQLRRALSGLPPIDPATTPERAAQREVDALLSTDPDAAAAADPLANDAPVRRSRAEREADAEERLAALKRRMGK